MKFFRFQKIDGIYDQVVLLQFFWKQVFLYIFDIIFQKNNFFFFQRELNGESINPQDPRLDPNYYTYYYSHRNLDPRLPPPLVSPFPGGNFSYIFEGLFFFAFSISEMHTLEYK